MLVSATPSLGISPTNKTDVRNKTLWRMTRIQMRVSNKRLMERTKKVRETSPPLHLFLFWFTL